MILLVLPNWQNSSTGYRCHRPPTYLLCMGNPLLLCQPTTTLSAHYHFVNPLPLCQPTATLLAKLAYRTNWWQNLEYFHTCYNQPKEWLYWKCAILMCACNVCMQSVQFQCVHAKFAWAEKRTLFGYTRIDFHIFNVCMQINAHKFQKSAHFALRTPNFRMPPTPTLSPHSLPRLTHSPSTPSLCSDWSIWMSLCIC